ncbi:hypothetical protein [Streptomyces fractus]|uniref:hypothetical protein n=1 Tax=Streptomyces fractus TaxID=641806 RepID=UPI003CEAE57E
MAPRKARTAPAPAVKAPKCRVCKGSGEVSIKVRVGRKQRPVGDQTGLCLTCFGSGEATD